MILSLVHITLILDIAYGPGVWVASALCPITNRPDRPFTIGRRVWLAGMKYNSAVYHTPIQDQQGVRCDTTDSSHHRR